MRTRASCTAVFLCVLCHVRPAAAQVDQERAQAFFKEAHALCERDAVRLWGVSFCAPMIVGDPRTKVEFEHRHIERAVGAEQLRAGVDSEGGWNGLLAMFAAKAKETVA